MRQLDKRYLALLLPLMQTLGSGEALETNVPNIVHWITSQEFSLRTSAIPLLIHIGTAIRTQMMQLGLER